MTEYKSLQNIPDMSGYRPGDLLVLIGELFGRGYANGLVEEALRLGMTVIGTTVGRRDSDGSLRPLSDEELAESEKILGGTIINVPLEAGFDMEAVSEFASVAEQLKKARPDDWSVIKFDPDFLIAAKQGGTDRFRAYLKQVMRDLIHRIPVGSNLHFAHAMAGGIPRARVFMPLLNRVFKGVGDKYLPSENFWNSELGALCDASFNEVTADTFRYLLEDSETVRELVTENGGRVSYSAYGYHGTEVLVDAVFKWQSYTPYVQGFAKMRLEDIAAVYRQKGVLATVFNCPEIQTNSSALFLGVEISLYPLLTALKNAGSTEIDRLLAVCQNMLKEDKTVDMLLERANAYLASPILDTLVDYQTWPQHNTKEQAEFMLTASAELMGMHIDQKVQICAELSKLVFKATGRLMLHTTWQTSESTLWLNHDIIALLAASSAGQDII